MLSNVNFLEHVGHVMVLSLKSARLSLGGFFACEPPCFSSDIALVDYQYDG